MTAPDENDEKIFEEMRERYQEIKRRRAELGIVGMSPLRAAVFEAIAASIRTEGTKPTREQAMQELVDQAQELGMGYD